MITNLNEPEDKAIEKAGGVAAGCLTTLFGLALVAVIVYSLWILISV